MRRFILLLLLLLALSAQAQQPCSTTPVFTVSGEAPVLLTFQHATTRQLGNPSVTISGNQISVRQLILDIPPPPGAPGPTPCNSRTVSLGILAAGSYTVTWTYNISSGVPGIGPALETYTFAFAHGLTAPALDDVGLLGLALLLGTVGVLLLRR